MNDRVPLKLEKSTQHKCFFDPNKACGSRSRSKLAYQRKFLVRQAKKCGIPGATQLSLDALCLLMRELYFEKKKKNQLFQRFEDFDIYNPNSYLMIPVELGGILTTSNVLDIKKNTIILMKIKETLEKHKDKFDPIKLAIFGSIFFPDLYSIKNLTTEQQTILKKI